MLANSEVYFTKCIMLPKVSAFKTYFDETKYMFFLVKDKELLEKQNEIWDKVSKVIKKRFDTTVYN